MNQGTRQKTDWHGIWRSMMQKCSGVAYDQEGRLKRWEKDQANEYLKHSSDEYPKALNNLIQIKPSDKILDIGCGPGVLALPFSLISNSVTVVDISENMLQVIKEKAHVKGITNINLVNKYWLDTRSGVDILENYDVVVSSNSINLLGAQEKKVRDQQSLEWNLVAALEKMNQVGRRIYISFPFLIWDSTTVLRHLGKESNPWPDYVILHNVLRQMGIRPNVNVLKFINPNLDNAYLRHCRSWGYNLSYKERASLEKEYSNKVETLGRIQRWGVFSWKTVNGDSS